ncbi:histamine H2 receptor-like [Oculina patagonica]
MSTSNSVPATNITEPSSCDQSIETTFMVLNLTVGAVILLGNVLVFLSIATSPRLRQQPMNLFIASLAVTDIIMASCVVPGYSLFCVGCFEYALSKHCWFFKGSKDIALASSIYNLLTISYDRALAVYRPLRYSDVMTRRRAFFIMIMVWSASLTIASIRNFWQHTTTGAELIALNGLYNNILLLVVLLIPSTIISVVNIKIILTIRQQVRQVFALGHPQNAADEAVNPETQAEVARTRKGTLACALVVIVFVVSWIPRVSFNVQYLISGGRVNILLQKMSIFLFIVQSSVNPLIYSFYRADLRRAAVKLLSCNRF